MTKNWYLLHVSQGAQAKQEAGFHGLHDSEKAERFELWVNRGPVEISKLVILDGSGVLISQRLMDF